MTTGTDEQKLAAWVDALLAATVRELTDGGVVGGALIEAKPAWILPFQLLIGKIREQGDASTFSWFISGDVPTAIAEASVAATPREAARYFALRWQLNAAKAGDGVKEFVADAERLYRLVDQDALWQE